MSNLLFSNNAQTTLASGLTNVALTANLAPGSGVLFPAPTGAQYFMMTFVDAATGLVNEIVKVTNITGDVATIVRAQEGTSAKAWSAGDIAVNLWTSGSAQAMAQNTDLQNNAYSYSVDTGAANAYIGAYTPAITTLVDGMVLRLKAAHLNTGASTFTPNSGVVATHAIVGNNLSALIGGEVVVNGDIWLQWNTSVGSPGSWCLVATAVTYLTQAAADARYAALPGSAGQTFAAATINASGSVNSLATAATNTVAFYGSGSTTGSNVGSLQNTGGTCYFGRDSSVGTFTGVPYADFWFGSASNPLIVNINGTNQLTVSTTGVAVTGTASAAVATSAAHLARYDQVPGLGQSLANLSVGTTRVSGTPYTNATGKERKVIIAVTAVSGSPNLNVVVGGVTILNWTFPYGTENPFTFPVPPGISYTVTASGGATISRWSEES